MTETSTENIHTEKLEAMMKGLLNALGKAKRSASGSLGIDVRLVFSITDLIAGILGVPSGGGGGPILPVPQHLRDLVKISNRIVSFILDGETHFGTGILVGPSSVLTAAHLFFEQDRSLIDRHRLSRITVEVHTTLLGNILMEGDLHYSYLEGRGSNDNWVIDPAIQNDVAQRDVDYLDFAIVRLEKALGNDDVGSSPRGWFEIPTVEDAPVLVTDSGVRVFQFLDRKELLLSSGMIRGVIENGLRVLHSASTEESASGAAMVDNRSRLAGIHVAGAATGERPKYNRGLPIRRVAEIIDYRPSTGGTIRDAIRR